MIHSQSCPLTVRERMIDEAVRTEKRLLAFARVAYELGKENSEDFLGDIADHEISNIRAEFRRLASAA